MADAVKIDGFKLYKKEATEDVFIKNLDKDLRQYQFERTMAAGTYGISAYKVVQDVTDPEITSTIESELKYFTVNPFYKVVIDESKTVIDSEKISVTWTNETNANYFDGYIIYRVETDASGEKIYTSIAELPKTTTSYTFMRDDDTQYMYVISPKTYEGYHNADSDNIEVAVLIIPPIMLTDPDDLVYYIANWLYDGDEGYIKD